MSHGAGRLAVALALFLTVVGATQAAQTDLEAAQRLTWDRETRDAGIAALRQLIARDPGAAKPRLELGRVLTWDRSSRAEGVRLLRALSDEFPTRADIEEDLAEVLSWDRETRGEAIARLRVLADRQPERNSTHLLLAEILSWDSTTREEAASLYRGVLERDPQSVEARIGLARVLSWSGEMQASHALYHDAVTLFPDEPTARAGLAEVERWTGHPRAALRTLRDADDTGLDPVGLSLERARAYDDLGRPARALRQYENVLTIEPDHEAARRGAEAAADALRARLELGIVSSTESGDGATSKVQSVAAPATFFWHPGHTDAEAHAGVQRSWYDNDRGTTEVTTGSAGFETPLGNRAVLRAEAAVHDFEQADSEMTARLDVKFTPVDRFSIRIGGVRKLLQDARLTAVGEDIGGIFYGPLIRDEVFVGLSVRPARGWDAFVRFATGTIDGDNVVSNDRDAVYGGFGRSFRRSRHQLRLGYSAAWLSYDLDLSDFPPTALGGDGITAAGVGGYFSPDKFINHMIRIDGRGTISERVRWSYGGGVGTQSVETLGGDDDRTSSDAYLGLTWQMTDRWSLRARATRQDVAAAFDRSRLRVFFVRTF